MMRNPVYSGQFKRDLKTVKKRGKDMEKIKAPMRLLIEGELLPPEYKPSLGWELAQFQRCSHRAGLVVNLQN